MGNISSYSTSIQIPDAAPSPLARPVDNGFAQFAAAAQDFTVQKISADQQAQNQDARVKAVTGLEDLAQKYSHDPDYATALQRYQKDAGDLRASIAGNFETDRQQADFGNEFDLLYKAREVNLKDQVFARERDDRLGQLETSLGDFARQAASAQNPVERASIMQMAQKNIEGMTAAGYLGKEEAAKRLAGFHADMDEVSALQLIDANPAVAARQLKDGNFLTGLDPLKRVRLASAAEEEVKARDREAQARAGEAAAIARSNLADTMEVIRSGLPVQPDLINTAAAAAKASGRPELVQAVNEAADLAVWQNAARRSTPVQLQQELSQLSEKAGADGANAADATKFTLGRQILSTMSGELSRDPLSWADRQGVAKVEPLDFQNAGTDTMAARASAAHRVAGYYGVAPKFFTDEERSSLKQTLSEAPAQAQLALATSIVKGFGRDAAKALGEISNDAPVFAHLGGLLSSGPQYAATAEAGFTGARAMADKADVAPSGAKLDTAVASVLGTSLDERQSPTRQAAIGAARAIYTAEALKRGLTADTFDKDIFEQSLQRAMGQWDSPDGGEKGGVGVYNGRDVVLPAFMGQSDLKDTIRGIDDKSLVKLSESGGEPVHGDGKPFTAAELRDAYLVTKGNGLYQISVTDPSKGRELVQDKKTGGYFVLDLSNEGRLAAAGVHKLTRGEKAQSILDEAKLGTGWAR